jgi:hypothetical protein
MKIKSNVKAGFNPQPDPPGFQPQPDPPGRR